MMEDRPVGRPRIGAKARYFYVCSSVRKAFDTQFGSNSIRYMLPLMAIRGICACTDRWGPQSLALVRSLRTWLDRELDEYPNLFEQKWFVAELNMIDNDIARLMKGIVS